MEDANEKTLSSNEIEEGAGGCCAGASSQGKVGGEGDHEKATESNQMRGRLLDKEPSKDAEWLSSLSHSHLDLLISLKELAILRAKSAGYVEVAEKFDPRMLRALGIILMEYLKERIESASIFPGSSEGFALLSGRQFASQKHEENKGQAAIAENIKTPTRLSRKRLLDRSSQEELQSFKKPKLEDLNC